MFYAIFLLRNRPEIENLNCWFQLGWTSGSICASARTHPPSPSSTRWCATRPSARRTPNAAWRQSARWSACCSCWWSSSSCAGRRCTCSTCGTCSGRGRSTRRWAARGWRWCSCWPTAVRAATQSPTASWTRSSGRRSSASSAAAEVPPPRWWPPGAPRPTIASSSKFVPPWPSLVSFALL